MSKTLIYLGLALIMLGAAWPIIQKLGLGRLPGDVSVERGNFSFHFPITTMIVVSVVLTIVLNIIIRFFGRH